MLEKKSNPCAQINPPEKATLKKPSLFSVNECFYNCMFE